MLEIKNIIKKYGSFTALDNLTITIEHGVYGLLGANGAGKTTFLNLITDNIKRTAGDILYNGEEILRLGKSFRSRIGYTPQLQGMYDDFSAREFLRYIGALKGIKSKECKRQIEENLKLVSLDTVAHKRLSSFSGGMRQRTLLAAALLGNPEILMLDEPTAGLDPEQRIEIREHIAKIGQARTILLATHIVSDIETIAHKVIILREGKLLKFAPPLEIIREVSELSGKDAANLEDVYLYYFAKNRVAEV
jgi:ABC-type multidrug transport system ATPase subunit